MENRSHAIIAGLFVLLLGCAAILALWWLGQRDALTQRITLETKKNVTGLNVQAQVRYRGIRAGKVESIEPDPNDFRTILVTVVIDNKFKVSRGSTAHLGYQGLTGLAYIQIEDDGSKPELLEGKDGEPPRLALRDTLFDTLGDRAGNLLDRMTGISERLNRLLDDKNLASVARTLDNLAAGSDSLKELPALTANLRELFSPANVQRWQRIVAHVESVAGEAAPLTGEVRQLVTSMKALAERAESVAGSAEVAGKQLNASTLPQAEQMMRELNGSARQLSRLLEALERQPQMLITGRDALLPGPGESGFVAPIQSPLPALPR